MPAPDKTGSDLPGQQRGLARAAPPGARTVPDGQGVLAGIRRHPLPVQITGQAVSAFGDAFSNVAMPLLVLALTGSVAQMGVVVAVSSVAQLAGSTLAGPVVDRVDRRRLLIACDVGQLVLGGAIPVVWWLIPSESWTRWAIWLIYPIVALSSALSSVYEVAMRAVLPQIVPPDRLVKANAALTTCIEVSYGIGPAIAGLAVAAIGEENSIGVNALTFAVAAVAWYLIRPARSVAPEHEASASAPRQQLAGLRFLWQDRLLRTLTVLEVGNTVLAAGALTLFIYYLRHDLGQGSAAVGLMLTLGSVGAVLAAVSASRLDKGLGVGRAVLLGIAVQGVALAMAGFAHTIAAVAVLAVVFGFGQILAGILIMSTRQVRTPQRLIGRATAAALTVVLATRFGGSLASTTAAEHMPTTLVLAALGGLTLLMAVAGCFTTAGRGRPAPAAGPGSGAAS
ncbi:MFS transporter [Amycolatopsis sp. FU40]|uniref:MFS transporter n=1 Tax=Amycolatopsis sp. FU40 TaxID=2914159 RepID=UPI001F2EA451|nr:MFS transporter [Amycolatopsis sp. FU40]UKD58035.1 MFS transporter [Amycolatopsis sp. FU40]